MISMIAAMARNRAIGKDNKLLWHLPEDLKIFKRLTMGGVMIMGRKTFESIGKALPGRTTIVVSRNIDLAIDKVIVCDSLKKAIEVAHEKSAQEEIFIVGGGEIYRQGLEFTDQIYLSVVELEPEADTYFPEFSGFTLKDKTAHEGSAEFPAWEFQHWVRS